MSAAHNPLGSCRWRSLWVLHRNAMTGRRTTWIRSPLPRQALRLAAALLMGCSWRIPWPAGHATDDGTLGSGAMHAHAVLWRWSESLRGALRWCDVRESCADGPNATPIRILL